ncbi:MAG: fasciclin domain-containing protein [Solirubrobacteraceae bacterium]
MKKASAAILTGAAALAAATSIAAASPAKTTAMGQKNIVQTAVAAGQFKTLVSLVKQAGLAGALSGKGALTVFAPTDAAFAKVPKATLAALAKNRAELKAVLLYHVVKGDVTAAQASMLTSATTLEGASVPIRVSGTKVYVGGAQVIKADVKASNGIIHVINKVLIPPKQ